jgi:2-isopropylmalate synthase
MQKEKLIIFDTTLRDGEQSPGASMRADEKLRIAKMLEKMQVDVIEAGFPAASPGDFEAVFNIAKNIKNSTVCGLARALDSDIDKVGEAIKPANFGRIHTFIATSDIHMQKKLKMTPEQVIEKAIKAVKRARKWTDDVEFSAEDAGRTRVDFLCRIIEKTIDAGANTINIPDTVGYNIPHQFGNLIKTLKEKISNSDKAIFSVHCHNDLGLAVGNSLSAVLNGARQVECTINGLGERAGNAALEEIVMAVSTRADIFPCKTDIDTKLIVPASKLVAGITGFAVQPNKSIVGANAFAHEAGIHQDGVLKSRQTYEIMTAQDVGWDNNKLVLGKHSGRNAFKKKLADLGINLATDEKLQQIFTKFKELADKKHDIFDEDIQALISDQNQDEKTEYIKLENLEVSVKSGQTPSATITLNIDGEKIMEHSTGSGVVDATFSAIKKITKSTASLLLYSVNNITSGTDSQGEVTTRLLLNGKIANGQGADTDIVIASAKSYINALNKIHQTVEKKHPQV